jgi:hypothetical protein
MAEAKLNLKLFGNSLSDDLTAASRRPAVLFVPQKNLKVRYAKTTAKGLKGWVIGQVMVSHKLGIVYQNRYSGRLEVIKPNRNMDDVFYSYNGYLATGTGADPVFEII